MKKLLTLACLLTAMQWQCFAQTINWNSPTTISTSGVNASDPQIVIDANGNSTSVWVESNIIQASNLPFGGSWSAITSISNSGASTPKIGVDSSGNVTAAWVENGVVSSAALPFGGSWSTETAVSNTGASSVSLAVDNTGNAVATWIRNGFVEAAQKPFGGSWGTVSVLSTGGAESHPNVYIGSSGVIFAVWHSASTGNNVVTAAKGSVGGSWGTAANIIAVSNALSYDFPKVIVDGSGNATALWYRYNLSGSAYTNTQILGATLTSGSSTWVPTVLSNAGLMNVATFAFSTLKIDGSGNVFASWVNSYDGLTLNVETAVKPNSKAWQFTGEIENVDPYTYQFGASVASTGDSVVALMSFDGTNLNINSTETALTGITFNFFSVPVTISQGTDNAYPRVAEQYSSGTGNLNATCVWLQYNGTNTVVQAITGSKAAVAPPTSLNVVQNSNNFGVFTENYNTLTWTASTEPSLIRYIIYRNSVVAESVAPTAVQFVDQNAPSSGSIVYGVSAVTTDNFVSPIATFTFTP